MEGIIVEGLQRAPRIRSAVKGSEFDEPHGPQCSFEYNGQGLRQRKKTACAESKSTAGFSRLHQGIFKYEEMQRLLRSDVIFDVVIAEWILPTMGALAAKYGCPLIGITSSGASVTSMDSIGNPSHPVISPDQNLPVSKHMSFQERVASVVYSSYMSHRYRNW